MKKFTLFFMSLFLVLGTVWAKDEENTEFALQYSNPQDGGLVSTAYNISMTFTKDIVISQSEVSIDVVNSKTNEVVKITNCKIDDWNSKSVVFSFEKIEVEGKDGKEYRDQYIEKVGTYTYTIPAGLIKSIDGEEFAGGTYTFTIATFFEIADWSPKEVAKVSEIVFTFEKEITAVNIPETGLKCYYNYNWQSPTQILIDNANISEDKKSVTLTLATPLTNPGNYDIDIPMGMFVSGEETSMSKSIWFSVIDTKPSFSTNYNDGDKVKELGNLEITFKNVTEFEMVEGKAIIVALPSGDEIAGEVKKETNKFVVSFDADFTEVGTYTFIIPAGTFTMDGAENEGRIINVELYSFEIVPLKIDDVYPKAGETVDQLDRIVIKFNQIIEVSWTEDWMTQPSREIELTCGEKTYTLTYNPSGILSDQLEYLVNAEWDGYQYSTTPITEVGTYTLDLSQIIVNYAGEFVTEYGYTYASVWHKLRQACEGTYTWTVSGNNASVDNIPVAEGEQVIYDLLGRRVENISDAGIYIVNGKKVIVK